MIFSKDELVEQGQIVQDNAGRWRWASGNRFDRQPGSMFKGSTPGRRFNSKTGAAAGANKGKKISIKHNPFSW